MEKTATTDKTPRLNILRSGDPKTSFGRMSPAEILDKYGPRRPIPRHGGDHRRTEGEGLSKTRPIRICHPDPADTVNQ